MVKAAVILSGCGYLDGAEIRESVLTLLYLDQANADSTIFAPDKQQLHVIDHINGTEDSNQRRNVMQESARIARGRISPLSKLDVNEFDILVIPGGYGVAKNLSDFATNGVNCTVDNDFKRVILGFIEQKKPIAAICIAPAVVAAAVQGKYPLTLTIGDDAGTAAAIEKFGCTHKNCATDDFVYDETYNIASCSAYMRDEKLQAVAAGIEKTILKVTQIAKQKTKHKAA